MQASAIDENHLLAAITEEGTGVGATILRHAGVRLKEFRLQGVETPSPNAQVRTFRRLPLEPSVENVLRRATDEAIGLGDNYVGTEHLALALARGNSEVMARELTACGSSLEGLRCTLRALRCLDQARHFLGTGDLPQAIRTYRLTLEINPLERMAANDLAWLLATCPDQELRSGTEALKLMEWVTTGSGNWAWWNYGTVAAAYAETGQFDEAANWGNRARELAAGEDMGRWEKWLDEFREKRPIRQDASTYRR